MDRDKVIKVIKGYGDTVSIITFYNYFTFVFS